MSKEKLFCEDCTNDVNECSYCGGIFIEGDYMLCANGEHHFCGEDCAINYYFDTNGIIESEVRKEVNPDEVEFDEVDDDE